MNWKVMKNGKQISEHRHYSQAESAAKSNGDEVVYRNDRGLQASVWTRPAGTANVDAGGYL